MEPDSSQSIDVVVRFSASIPDVILPIASPQATSTITLKQSLRPHLPPPANHARLRLIHAGKVLPDTVALSKSLPISPPPQSAKAQGKQPIRDTPRIYIHCSIGDGLTPSELSEEEAAAKAADAAISAHTSNSARVTVDDQHGQSTSTTPAPQGFDRLLSAGFTQPEVTALRSQFLAIQSHSHTPESMPTGPELLALEERWLDGSSNPSADTLSSDESGALEDILYGNLAGFFWPVGAAWLLREEGVWSRRRQIAVLTGFMVNLLFGFLRVIQ